MKQKFVIFPVRMRKVVLLLFVFALFSTVQLVAADGSVDSSVETSVLVDTAVQFDTVDAYVELEETAEFQQLTFNYDDGNSRINRGKKPKEPEVWFPLGKGYSWSD
ncbi:MAG: hypothetical protein GY943_08200 [Chloroflexi bacterium]|nr:hypothetical protein [Chloroflexota bacterium]